MFIQLLHQQCAVVSFLHLIRFLHHHHNSLHCLCRHHNHQRGGSLRLWRRNGRLKPTNMVLMIDGHLSVRIAAPRDCAIFVGRNGVKNMFAINPFSMSSKRCWTAFRCKMQKLVRKLRLSVAVANSTSSVVKSLKIQVEIQGKVLTFLIDSGSSSCFINKSTILQFLGAKPLPAPLNVQLAGGSYCLVQHIFQP